MNDFLNAIQKKVLLFDGSKGVMLQRRGLRGEEAAEAWNLSKPDEIRRLYQMYIQAGSEVIQTNTFPGNKITLESHNLGDKTYQVNYEGVRLAKEVAGERAYVAASVGPTGKILEPAGDLSFEKAYDAFREQLRAIEDGGADVVNFETFTDLNELRAAILAAKETTSLPIIASVSFGENSRTMSGNSAEVCGIVCEALGVRIVGANCSGGPDTLIEPIRKMNSVVSIPLVVKANAGMPELVDGETVYKQNPEQFSSYTSEFIKNGVRLIGGCCGTTPEFIEALKKELEKVVAPDLAKHFQANLTSGFNHLVLNKECDLKTLSLKEEGVLNRLENQDYFSVLKDYRTAAMDCLLLDFGDSEGSFDVAGFCNTLSFAVKKPVILKAESGDLIRTFLKYYPGRAGVILTEGTAPLQHQFTHYGALMLDEQLTPLG